MLGIINRAIKAFQNINNLTMMYYLAIALGIYRQSMPTATLDFTCCFGIAPQSTLNMCHPVFFKPLGL